MKLNWILLIFLGFVVENNAENVQWITPTKSICINNGGSLSERKTCRAKFPDAKKICSESGGRLPSPEELTSVITECGGIIVRQTRSSEADFKKMEKNKKNKSYQSCYFDKKGFDHDSYLTSKLYLEGELWYVKLIAGHQYPNIIMSPSYVRCVGVGSVKDRIKNNQPTINQTPKNISKTSPTIKSIKYKDGSSYNGAVLNGKKEGRGTTSYANGDKYKGEFKNDKRDGKGSYDYANGDKFVGKYINDKRDGDGIYTFAQGTNYAITYKNNIKIGKLRLLSKSKPIIITSTSTSKWIKPTETICQNNERNLSSIEELKKVITDCVIIDEYAMALLIEDR